MGWIPRKRADGLSLDDFEGHVRVSGVAGCGKTSLIKEYAKHIEAAALDSLRPHGPLDDAGMRDGSGGSDRPCAFIYVGAKDGDPASVARQCEAATFGAGRLHYLDPSVNFSINPLELPRHDARDGAVSLAIQHVLDMMRGWHDSPAASRLLHAVLRYMYAHVDAPTLADLRWVLECIRSDDQNALKLMYATYGDPGVELGKMLGSAARFAAETSPVLDRLEWLDVDPVLRTAFCRSGSTAWFGELVMPGHYTVVDLTDASIPAHARCMAMDAFLSRLWFEALDPARRGTRIIVVVDGPVKSKALDDMVASGRQYGLSVVLAGREMKQSDVESAGTDFNAHVTGRLSGHDAQRLALSWDPACPRRLGGAIALQPAHHWTARIGHRFPVKFRTGIVKHAMSEAEWSSFLKSESTRYADPAGTEAVFKAMYDDSNRWKMFLDADVPKHKHWHVMLMLRNGPLNLKDITELYNPEGHAVAGTLPRDKISAMLRDMVERGMLVRESGRSGTYELAKPSVFSFDSSAVGSASDVAEIVDRVTSYYLDKGCFLAVPANRMYKTGYRVNMIAYDYATSTPIDVEIESEAEMGSHPEHVRFNMLKWPNLGFRACHVWSFHPRVEEEYDRVSESLRKDVTVFVAGRGGEETRVISGDTGVTGNQAGIGKLSVDHSTWEIR